MLKLFGLFFIFGLIISCTKKTSSQTAGGTPINLKIPLGFDSLNWSKEYKFQTINQQDFKNKKRFLEEYYENYWLKNNVSGSFLVAQHGEIIFEGYSGLSDIEKEIPITPHTSIHTASISKVLTGLAVLKLIEKNKIKLEDPVSNFFPGFPYEDVTIENLLTHRSGLPNYIYVFDDKKYWDPVGMVSNQDVLDVFINKKPESQGTPGRNFSYNNTNYVLLALIIEKITGKSFPKAMKEMVFDPLGMQDTFVLEYEKDAGRVSKSYYNNGRIWADNHLDKTYGDKNIYSTPRDLLKMDIAMYSDKFLSKGLKERAWRGYSYESKGVKNYGLGIRMMEWDGGEKYLYHTGWWHGNNTNYIRDYGNEAVIIALGNRRNKTVYNTFQLTHLFGTFPGGQADSGDMGGLESRDSIMDLNKKMDSVRNLEAEESKSEFKDTTKGFNDREEQSEPEDLEENNIPESKSDHPKSSKSGSSEMTEEELHQPVEEDLIQ